MCLMGFNILRALPCLDRLCLTDCINRGKNILYISLHIECLALQIIQNTLHLLPHNKSIIENMSVAPPTSGEMIFGSVFGGRPVTDKKGL